MQHEGDTYCKILMKKAKEGRSGRLDVRKKKKRVRRNMHDREDQIKIVLIKSVLARVIKGCGNRALPRMYQAGFKNGCLSSKQSLDSSCL